MYNRSMPPRFDTKPKREPLILRVRVCECHNDNELRVYTINYSNPVKKQWLMKTLVWAAFNGKYLEIMALSDDEKYS